MFTQGGCKSPGDEVEDTPAQAKPSSGCPKKVASCGKTEFDLSSEFLEIISSNVPFFHALRPQTTSWITRTTLAWIALHLYKLNA